MPTPYRLSPSLFLAVVGALGDVRKRPTFFANSSDAFVRGRASSWTISANRRIVVAQVATNVGETARIDQLCGCAHW